MSPNHSKSTIANSLKHIDTQFHEQSLFFDASDSFDSIINDDDANVNTSIQSNKTPESPSSSPSNHPQPVDSDHKIPKKLKNSDKLKRKLRSSRVHNSAVTSVDEDDRINATDSSVSVSGSNLLFLLAGLVIKMMGFQLNLFFGSVTLPMWLIYYSYMFMIDPFRSINLVKCYILRKISRILGFVKWVMQIWIRKHESTLRLCVRIGWGLLWLVYVGFVLCSLLVFAFVVSGVMLKCMIEEPVQITRQLSFDYTKDSPTAFVPVMSCPGSSFLESGEAIWYGCGVGSRVIPLDHKVRGTVSLTLPESDYNRNLGIFQVRVDFLNGDGKCLFSTRQPCMLRYKSQPIRLLLTFLKLAPLITGYSSEAQTLNMKFSGYTEGTVPTLCLRVFLEQ